MARGDAVVLETGPEEVEGIVLRFDPAAGVIVDYFPERTAFTDESLAIVKSHPGVLTVQGKGGIGSKVTVSVANGQAIYELTYRVTLSSGASGFAAELKSAKTCMAGKPVEVTTFARLEDFTDLWPVYAGFTAEFIQSFPQHIVRKGRMLTIYVDGVSADYKILSPHPTRKQTWIAERQRLLTKRGIVITLPAVSARAATTATR